MLLSKSSTDHLCISLDTKMGTLFLADNHLCSNDSTRPCTWWVLSGMIPSITFTLIDILFVLLPLSLRRTIQSLLLSNNHLNNRMLSYIYHFVYRHHLGRFVELLDHNLRRVAWLLASQSNLFESCRKLISTFIALIHRAVGHHHRGWSLGYMWSFKIMGSRLTTGILHNYLHIMMDLLCSELCLD